ncbi:MAG: M4 family metallopeptidase [Bacteroidales bacterium]|jgi:Zn-dependent metalloprotease|nr:M4 family metallopeptidase [Bacteroidales bacterium]
MKKLGKIGLGLFGIVIFWQIVYAQETQESNVSITLDNFTDLYRDEKGTIKHARVKENAPITDIMRNDSLFLNFMLNMSPDCQFEQYRENTDEMGYIHKKFWQYYKGIKVESGAYVTHWKNGYIYLINGYYQRVENLDTTLILSQEQATQAAKEYVSTKLAGNGVESATLCSYYSVPEIVICTNKLNPQDTAYHVAYKIDIYAKEVIFHKYIYVCAKTGAILKTNSIFKEDNGSADTRYSGTRTISTTQLGMITSILRDNTRGDGIETYNLYHTIPYPLTTVDDSATFFTDDDNNWTVAEFHNANKDDGALDAHWGAMIVYDYFKYIHGRNSYDNSGAIIRNYVHYGANVNNALWNAEAGIFVYGDGDNISRDIYTCLDIVSHEFAHAFCDCELSLDDEGEQGAMAEGICDIWGACVENYANIVYPTLNKQEWLHGEEVGWGTPSRSLSSPKDRNCPDTYGGTYWKNTADTADNGGIHTNCGVINHWFYLLSEGGYGINDNDEDYVVNGIGISAAEGILYRFMINNTNLLTTFYDMRVATIDVAKDLYGNCSPQMMSVAKAWHAVGVGSNMTKAGVDLMVRDGLDDPGDEPYIGTNSLWNSPDIWVRNLPDKQKQHQNPEYHPTVPNYVYVRVKNVGCQASTGNELLKLYWAKANMLLSWTKPWDGTTQYGGMPLGGIVDSLYIPALQSGQDTILEIPWVVPNPANYTFNGEPWHFCLLSRIVSANDNMAHVETADLSLNVAWNNNIAWKNLSIVDVKSNQSIMVAVANLCQVDKIYNIQFSFGDVSDIQTLENEAEMRVKLDDVLYNSWIANGQQLSDMAIVGNQTFLVTGKDATLKNIHLDICDVGFVTTQINFLTEEVSEVPELTFRTMLIDVETYDTLGGETYNVLTSDRILFYADAGEDIYINGGTSATGTSITLSATPIGEAAVYKWYNHAGELVGEGETITTNVYEPQSYKLEVIAEEDGYKDYDMVYVGYQSDNKIENIQPNPAQDFITVFYQVNNVQNAQLEIKSIHYFSFVSNYFLNINDNNLTIDISNFPIGMCSVSLICDGQIVDNKTFVKN